MTEHETFSYDLSRLPDGPWVTLSAAMTFALYGGIPTLKYEGAISPARIEEGCVFVRDGTRCLGIWRGRGEPAGDDLSFTHVLVGPKETDLPKAGAVLFGVRTDEDIEERLAHLEQKLNDAASAETLHFCGHRTEESFDADVDVIPPDAEVEAIPATYFRSLRGFDEVVSRINSWSVNDARAVIAEASGSRSGARGWANVTVHRGDLDTFLIEIGVTNESEGHRQPDGAATREWQQSMNLPHRRPDRRDLAAEALRKLFPKGIDGEKRMLVTTAVNAELRKNGGKEVSTRTVTRALKYIDNSDL